MFSRKYDEAIKSLILTMIIHVIGIIYLLFSLRVFGTAKVDGLMYRIAHIFVIIYFPFVLLSIAAAFQFFRDVRYSSRKWNYNPNWLNLREAILTDPDTTCYVELYTPSGESLTFSPNTGSIIDSNWSDGDKLALQINHLVYPVSDVKYEIRKTIIATPQSKLNDTVMDNGKMTIWLRAKCSNELFHYEYKNIIGTLYRKDHYKDEILCASGMLDFAIVAMK